MKHGMAWCAAALVLALLVAGCANCPFRRVLGIGCCPGKEPAQASEAAAISQKTCPVMGGKIDPQVSVDYEGKRVYFCCPSCIKTFEKDPKKYLAKLTP